MNKPLMAQATAVWLVDNTTLTFHQIADFCGLHHLEIQSIADGVLAASVTGVDPVVSGELTRTEIKQAENDPEKRLSQNVRSTIEPNQRTKGPRYTPLSKRQNRPDAIAWMIRHHPEILNAHIGKLLGTTKTTIDSIRNRTHWNMANLQPRDPVSLGLCTQIDLDALVAKYAAKAEAAEPKTPEHEDDTHLAASSDAPVK